MLLILYIVSAVLIFGFFYLEFGEFCSVDGLFFSMFSCFILGAVLLALAQTPLFWGEPEIVKTNIEIVSVRNSSTVQGSFFLGCGSFGGEEIYVIFEKQDDSFVKRRIGSGTLISQTDETPHIEYQFKKWVSNNWLIPRYKIRTQDEYMTATKIVVPKNTIIENFKIE